MLKHKTINGWRPFWLVTGPISVAMIIAMMGTDLFNGPAVSSMIQFSVRCAVPLLFITFGSLESGFWFTAIAMALLGLWVAVAMDETLARLKPADEQSAARTQQ